MIQDGKVPKRVPKGSHSKRRSADGSTGGTCVLFELFDYPFVFTWKCVTINVIPSEMFMNMQKELRKVLLKILKKHSNVKTN